METCEDSLLSIEVSFRGNKLALPLRPGTMVGEVKSLLVAAVNDKFLSTADVKLLLKGKVLVDDQMDLYQAISQSMGKSARAKRPVRLIATGVSRKEVSDNNRDLAEGIKTVRVRDDLTEQGCLEEARRKAVGGRALARAAAKSNGVSGLGSEKYGFGRIETLNLPNEAQAREILTQLANDPGVIACMAKHRWNVPCLAEMYPEGKVGESEVCVMGLNQNKGQKILLRIRTDDLKGFRKILSIRKVLFHELAHNVHSDHDDDFFRLMRQIERECNEMDWTQSSGRTLAANVPHMTSANAANMLSYQLYTGGSGKLGGIDVDAHTPLRELTARAALQRLTAEEEEIQRHCGCKSNAHVDEIESTMVTDKPTQLEGNGESNANNKK